MNMLTRILTLFIFSLCIHSSYSSVRLKSLVHLAGHQENPITGYGLVVGLAGSGDSHRNKETTQAISNLLKTFGVILNPHEINSRNTATVIITANLPANAHQGDKLDINVASLGDAKSLSGGTLLITPLKGADNRIYALAQGALSLGGFKYDLFGNQIQKNHPTTGIVSGGAIVEKTIYDALMDKSGKLHLVLNHPDFTTADHIEAAVNHKFGPRTAIARSAQDIDIFPPKIMKNRSIRFLSELENLVISPDNLPTVIVNERTGVVISGADVKIDAVTISQGNINISIATDYKVSQPELVSLNSTSAVIAPSTNITVKESAANLIKLNQGATVADLIAALGKTQTSTRDLITILESLKRAGALHAELIIQ